MSTLRVRKYVLLPLLTIALVFAGLVNSPQVAHADTKSIVCEQVLIDGQPAEACAQNPDTIFTSVVKPISNVLSLIIGATSVIMIIIGGFRYVVSAGDQNAVTAAKNTILYAIVGLIIAMFVAVIANSVVNRVRNTPSAEVSIAKIRNLSKQY